MSRVQNVPQVLVKVERRHVPYMPQVPITVNRKTEKRRWNFFDNLWSGSKRYTRQKSSFGEKLDQNLIDMIATYLIPINGDVRVVRVDCCGINYRLFNT